MTFKKPDMEYWNRKLAAYMHDPLDKVFKIQGHEHRAALFLEKYGLQPLSSDYWKKADGIAAGLERGQVPTYSSDPLKNGAVDFLTQPVITHPTSDLETLGITLSGSSADQIDRISKELIEFIEKDIGMDSGQKGYSDTFRNDEAGFAMARFLYNHLVLRFRLAEEDVGGLGAFWHRIPADSRFPDHSIWQHNALCSAVSSSIELAHGNIADVGMMVFSITPVQAFISKARKLRDSWTGSVLLSWLAFEGIRWVMENLGPDHILYPSLIDQPLVNEYLQKTWHVPSESFLNPPKDIASFPNKFLFVIPMNLAESIADGIKGHIKNAWKDLYKKVCENTLDTLGSFLCTDDEKNNVRRMFERQGSEFWDLQWAASSLVTKEDFPEIQTLLPESAYQTPFALVDHFNDIIKVIEGKYHFDKSGRGVLYSVGHALVQGTLAAAKTRKTITRLHENGEKCHLCGEFEVVHHKTYKGDISAGEYKNNTKEFWKTLKTKWDRDESSNPGYNLNENEKLCSICLTKRMACETMEKDKGHILHSVFSGNGNHSFPSTTDIALRSYFDRKGTPENERKKIAQAIHEKTDDRTDNRDRYYAILLMDGDKMGKLINGETMASTWKSVMHPEIVKRLEDKAFDPTYHKPWKQLFDKHTQRLVTPAIHAAISEALGDFSLYGVSSIIKKHKGRLIYAGGDDVCAVLPVDNAFPAASEIQEYYTSTYKWIPKDREKQDITDASGTFTPQPGKLSINLGKGEDISISAGILVCHHKESLTQMIAEAQHLLKDKAKKEGGRNACAIELRKRSGGSRFFVRKWSETAAWKSFMDIGKAISSKDKAQVSTSLVYRLEQLRLGVEALLTKKNWKEQNMLQKLIGMQLDRSSVGEKIRKDAFAEIITDLVVVKGKDGNPQFKPEGLIVAAFMAKGGE